MQSREIKNAEYLRVVEIASHRLFIGCCSKQVPLWPLFAVFIRGGFCYSRIVKKDRQIIFDKTGTPFSEKDLRESAISQILFCPPHGHHEPISRGLLLPAQPYDHRQHSLCRHLHTGYGSAAETSFPMRVSEDLPKLHSGKPCDNVGNVLLLSRGDNT